MAVSHKKVIKTFSNHCVPRIVKVKTFKLTDLLDGDDGSIAPLGWGHVDENFQYGL
jgi:hypothetical protein